MKVTNKVKYNCGVILIISMLVLMVISSIVIVGNQLANNNNRSAIFTSCSMEAQQKAAAIADFVARHLESYHYADPVVDDLTPCAMAKNCEIWSSDPGNIPIDSSATSKLWWATNAQDYQSTDALQANDSNGMANYVIIQDYTSTNTEGYNIRALRVLAYATDSSGKVAAVKQLYYPWVATAK